MSITLSCPIYSSFRVEQIAGMFDISLAAKAERTIVFEPPPLDDPSWKIGCIVGPSGSGKTSIVKEIFGKHNVPSPAEGGLGWGHSVDQFSPHPSLPPRGEGTSHWNPNKAVIDGFGERDIKDIVSVLTIVGFSSPPSWIKPYSVLSNGEQFRCDLARALLSGECRVPGGEKETNHKPLVTTPVVFDEFTSVVDRNVAQAASAAISKAIKSGKLNCRFVAVTCHYDILDWLEPDWVLDTATGQCSRRLLRRPNIELEIFRCERSLWNMFKTHHYLSGNLAKTCRCYAALRQDKPIAFCALIPQQGFERWFRVSRIVTLPDYQGLGIGSQFLDSLAEFYAQQNYRFSITASHPSVLSHCKRSAHWKASNVQKLGSKHSRGRAVASFIWC